MPIYMDLHIIPGVKAKDVANAHLMDVMIQKEHSCTCMTYWIDEARGHVFCLIDAPAMDVVTELHNKAHGLIPHKIIEVQTSLVESFLGRVSDPEDVAVTDEGLKLINDPSYRFLVVIRLSDPVVLQYNLGKQKANAIINDVYQIIRKQLTICTGVEAEHDGSTFIASFTSAAKALACATAIREKIITVEGLEFSIAITAGEPVTSNQKLFGDAIQLAEHICFIAKPSQIWISSEVKKLLKDNDINISVVLSPQDEHILLSMFKALNDNWRKEEFNMDNYAQQMAMSKSQLYRKTISLTGLSPNALLNNYKLENAKTLLNKRNNNVSQITFDAGFSSPSYFTKCFKKKYGILPLAYLDMQN